MISSTSKYIRVHLLISGTVQGVCFRYHTQTIAEKYGLTGWVRNLFNGNVEVVVEGKSSQVQKFVDWCHHGPENAVVNTVTSQNQKFTGEFTSFEIRELPYATKRYEVFAESTFSKAGE